MDGRRAHKHMRLLPAAALGAVVNAIVDALGELGVEHVEMPATPERVWQAISAARLRRPAVG